MNEIGEFLRIPGLFAGGLLLRLLLVVLVVALYAIPVFLAWGVYRLYEQALGRRAGLEPVDGLLLAGERHYAPGHTWLEPRRLRQVRVGLDDIGQRILPGAIAISLPRIGTKLTKGHSAAVIASGHREASIPSPIDGTVTSVNRAVGRRPGLLNRAPYGRGWLFSVMTTDPTWAKLPTGGTARDWFRTEERRLAHFMEAELGMAAADGGEVVIPGPAALPREKWDRLVKEFLGA